MNPVETLRQLLHDDQRAVSPVIGVILMVAITVILAAVVATFVLGLGDSLLGSTAPTASTDISDNSGWGDENGDAAIFIDHNSGSSMEMGDLELQIRDSNGQVIASFGQAGSWEDTDADLELSLDGSSTISADDQFSVGSQIIIQNTADDSSLQGDTEYRIQLVHTPSDSTAADGSVTMPNP